MRLPRAKIQHQTKFVKQSRGDLPSAAHSGLVRQHVLDVVFSLQPKSAKHIQLEVEVGKET
jgi:hypothetical protein